MPMSFTEIEKTILILTTYMEAKETLNSQSDPEGERTKLKVLYFLHYTTQSYSNQNSMALTQK